MSGKEIDEELLAIAINKLMSRFIEEVKRKDGNPYPPSILVSLVSGTQWYLRENGRAAVSFFNEKDSTYDLLRKSLDAKMKTLAKDFNNWSIANMRKFSTAKTTPPHRNVMILGFHILLTSMLSLYFTSSIYI